jgi:hypothetical protein
MAPGGYNYFNKDAFYDHKRDAWAYSTYRELEELKPLTANAVDKIYDGFADFGEKYMREAQRQLQRSLYSFQPRPMVVDEKQWKTMFLGDWGIDKTVPDGQMPVPPKQGLLDAERDAERKRKIHNLYWARKQKDPEFNLLT